MTQLEIEASRLNNEVRKTNIEAGKLAETIRNNNLQHDVNVTKNEIQRLYNDQLNERELTKLANDLYVALEKLDEEEYWHDVQATLEQDKLSLQDVLSQRNISANEIASASRGVIGDILDALLSSTGYQWNTDNLTIYPDDAYTLLFGDPSEYYIQRLWMEGDPRLRQFMDKYYDIQDDGLPNGSDNSWNHPSPSFNPNPNGNSHVDKFENSTLPSRKHGRRQDRIAEEDRIRDKQNEIPSDKSQSGGPGVTAPNGNPSYSDVSSSQTRNTSDWRNLPSNYDDNTSGGTDYHIDGGLHSEGVIIAP